MKKINGNEESLNDHQFVFLLKEYELFAENYSRSENGFFQIIAWIVSILTAITSLLVSQTGIPLLEKISSLLAWGTPFIAIFLFNMLLWQYYQLEGYIRRCRIVTEQINQKFKKIVLSQFSFTAKTTSFFTSHRGNIKHTLVFRLIIFLVAIFYLAPIALSLLIDYQENHLGGFILSIVVVLATFILLYSFTGAIIDLPKHYNQVYEEVRDTGLIPESPDTQAKFNPFNLEWKSLIRVLIPRRNLIEKGIIFWYGFIGAFALIGIQQSQVNLINTFFSRGTDYTINNVPAWSIWMLGAIYFFVEELLLQQAKYLWNDIRDRQKDFKNPYRQDRIYGQRSTTSLMDVSHVIFRWMLALVIGFFLGGWQLFFVFVFISIHQAVYVLWGKPRGDKHPIILLTIISFNIAPRILVGIMAISGILPITVPMLTLFAIFHFFSFGFMAAYWKMEAIKIQDNTNSKINIPKRPQSKYFYSEGNWLQHQGFLGAIVSSLFLLVGYPFLSGYLLQINPYLLVENTQTNNYIFALAFVLLFILFIHLFVMLVRKIFGGIKKFVNKIILSVKLAMMIISYLFFFFCLALTLVEKNQVLYIYFIAILFMNIGAYFMYEGMTWDELLGLEMRRQTPFLTHLWLTYFFAPPETLGKYSSFYLFEPTLRNLIFITFAVLSNKTIFPAKQKPINFPEK